MKALAYLLGARALDVARDADSGIRWPKPEEQLEPLATTEASAAAWRRWRDGASAGPTLAERARGSAPLLSPKGV